MPGSHSAAVSGPGPDSDIVCNVRKRIDFGLGTVQEREYAIETIGSKTWSQRRYSIDVALTTRPRRGWGRYVDGANAHGRLGPIVFVPAGRTVQYGTEPGRIHTLFCAFSPRLIEELLPHAPYWHDAALAEGLQLEDPDIRFVLARIRREVAQQGFASALMIESLLRALAICVVRKFRLERPEAYVRHAGGLAPWRLHRIRERVYSGEPLPDIAEIAQLCGMSVRHLNRAFKIETGRTVSSYIEQVMIERAEDLLANSRVSVDEIARTLGFSGASSFTLAFRRATGLRPSEVDGRRRAPRRS